MGTIQEMCNVLTARTIPYVMFSLKKSTRKSKKVFQRMALSPFGMDIFI